MYLMVSLLQCGDGSAASGVFRKLRVQDLVTQVEALYQPWESSDAGDAAISVPSDTTPPRGARGASGATLSPSMAAAAVAATVGTGVKTEAGTSRGADEGTSEGAGVSDAAVVTTGDFGTRKTIMEKAGKFLPSLSPRPSRATAPKTVEEASRPKGSPMTSGAAEGSHNSPNPKPESLFAGKGDISPRPGGTMRERMALLRSPATLSPPRIDIITNPFRRAVEKINGVRSAEASTTADSRGTTAGTDTGMDQKVAIGSSSFASITITSQPKRTLSPEPGVE